MNGLRLRKDTIALIAVCLAALMVGLEISSVPTILPTLETVLHTGLKQVQWIMNAYTIACTTVLMATGTLADRFGRKRVFLVSIVLFGVTSLVCGLARTAAVLIVSRFLQGMGGGAMLICLIAILTHQFRDAKERSRAFGWWGTVFGFGLGFGPLVGGIIVALSSWQWVFLVHVVIAAVTLALAIFGVQESRDPQAKRLDLAGIVLLSAAILGLTCFITQGPGLGFTSLSALAILGGSVLSLLLFVVAELMQVHPMFDFSVFRVRDFSGAILGSIGMNFSFWPFMIYLPLYFQTGLQYGSVAAGSSLLAYTLPTLVVPPFAEQLALRYRPGIVIPVGLFAIGAGFFMMAYSSCGPHASWLTMLPGSLLSGAGLGLTNTPVTNTTTGAVPVTRAGMATGIDMSARLITLAVNIAMMGFLLVEGISAYLKQALSERLSAAQLNSLAETIAGGETKSAAYQTYALSTSQSDIFHAAFLHGFRLVMLYGGVGVSILAIASLVTFHKPTNSALAKAATLEKECVNS